MRLRPELSSGPDDLANDRHTLRAAHFAIMACLIFLLIPLLRLLWTARAFPIVWDAAMIHYVVFMVGHGHAPYAWMLEMNTPGTLMTEWFSVHMFGPNASGLWWWDVFSGVLAAAGAAWIAERGYRLAAVSGVALAWFVQLMSGPETFAERDWFVGALLLLAAGSAAQALRSDDARWAAGVTVLGGWACTIKPHAALFPVVFVVVVLLSTRDRWRPLLWACVGALFPLVAVLLYLHHWPGAFDAFLHIERTIGASYSRERNPLSMFIDAFLHPVMLMFVLVSVLWAALRFSRTSTVLFVAGTVCAALYYVVQGKGYVYHTYPLLLFAITGGCVAAQQALQRGPVLRVVAAIFLLAGFVWIPVRFWRHIPETVKRSASMEAIERDLTRLGGGGLDQHVQCMDIIGTDCIAALYDLRLQQSTGFIGDFMLFPYGETSFTAEMRERFLSQFNASPPRVIILSNHNAIGSDVSFTKLDRWPEFEAIVQRDYSFEKQVMPGGRLGYRIYVRKTT